MARRRPTKVTGNFASGIGFPFRGDGDGGVVLTEGDDYIRGMILSAMQTNYSDNPFQDIGGTDYPIFQIAHAVGWRQVYKRRVRRTFEDLEREKLAKLVSVTFPKSVVEGVVSMTVRYINLESTVESDITVGLQGAHGAGTARQIPGFGG